MDKNIREQERDIEPLCKISKNLISITFSFFLKIIQNIYYSRF